MSFGGSRVERLEIVGLDAGFKKENGLQGGTVCSPSYGGCARSWGGGVRDSGTSLWLREEATSLVGRGLLHGVAGRLDGCG